NNDKDENFFIRYVNNRTYKLYDTLGYKNFYNIKTDANEAYFLLDSVLILEEIVIKLKFEHILQKMYN
ncbi:MAG TPA: hypothetical protein VN958_03800, partial [Chitinophagaceae bacterium]|nr:hypothetical protein [Chitinophagaceae bacterium]